MTAHSPTLRFAASIASFRVSYSQSSSLPSLSAMTYLLTSDIGRASEEASDQTGERVGVVSQVLGVVGAHRSDVVADVLHQLGVLGEQVTDDGDLDRGQV